MINEGKLNGISLFSGYGGIDLALGEWVEPMLYCEIEKYAQAIILSRMDDRSLPFAPIWNDVTTLNGELFKGLVDIIYGGFPCQDISVAGKGLGLEGKRSGLFFEIIRICKEASPQFIFLENVPAIRTRGAIEVQEALANLGYASRWIHLSAAEVGANHKRERWFCLAYSHNSGCDTSEKYETIEDWKKTLRKWQDSLNIPCNEGSFDSNTLCERLERQREESIGIVQEYSYTCDNSWWKTEPSVGRMVNGLAFQSHRIKALGNGVVPLQVKTAFKELMGIE